MLKRFFLPSNFGEGDERVNKIKFTFKYEWDMINVCHVGSWIGGNETPHTFKGVFRHEIFFFFTTCIIRLRNNE